MSVDAFTDLLEVDNSLVRKWGRPLIALQDYDEPVPTSFFDPTTKVPILPATAKQLGFITTDGTTNGKNVSSTDTTMAQWVEPVRTDTESIVKTIAAGFGEGSNAWVQAVYEGLPVEQFPEFKNAPWLFDGGEISDFPYYRLWAIYADGTGDQAFYRVEYHYRVRVTSIVDRSMVRANPETLGFTFGAFKDPITGRDITRTENGPGYPDLTP